jgi:pimeloyl-ACP methyl ester carboxylesterase
VIPFRIAVDQGSLDDLRERLSRTRWPDEIRDAGWDYGVNELLTNLTVSWVTQTAGSSARSYDERARDPRQVRPDERVRVPTGVALTTEAVQRAPREWVERRHTDLRRWTEFPRGGHFLALEDPELLARELRAFFRAFRRG